MTEFESRSLEFSSFGASHGETPGRAAPPVNESAGKSKPSAEVVPKRPKRRFSAKEKLRILTAADGCVKHGELGALLRREGLYSSQLASWRLLRNRGELSALTDKKRGRKADSNPLRAELAASRRQVETLTKKLEQAAEIIDVQKKIAALFGKTIILPPHCERSWRISEI